MTRRQAVAVSLAAWQAIYPNIKLEKETPRVWEEVLSDLEPESIVYAFKEALKRSEIAALPAVGVVRQLALDHERSRKRRLRDLEVGIQYLESMPNKTPEEELHLAIYKLEFARLTTGSQLPVPFTGQACP